MRLLTMNRLFVIVKMATMGYTVIILSVCMSVYA